MNPFPTSSLSTTADTFPAVHEGASATQFSALHPDIIDAHILTRLDGPTLASTSSCSASLHHLSSQDHLWSQACHLTWPSTSTPRVSDIITSFPDDGKARAFFSQSFPLPVLDPSPLNQICSSLPGVLISAVDIHYKDELIFSKVQETVTVTEWFGCSPFRIDLLEPKDAIPTLIKHPEIDELCSVLMGDMKLSWILVDPTGRRAVNLSSYKPVSVQRHWLTGEVQAKYSSILPAADRKGHVQCGIVVTCGRSEGGEMLVREVSMEMEDIEGMHLNGEDSLVILKGALEGKRGNSRNREVEGRRRYKEFLEKKKERKEMKVRTEGAFDIFCVALGICTFAGFWGLIWRFC